MLPEVKVFTKDNPCTKAEVWRDVPGYGGKYLVSNLGRVKSMPTKYHPRIKILKPWFQTKNRYPCVGLSVDGVSVTRSVHSLVAEAFLGPRPVGMNVLHKDGNGSRSVLSNLRYGTQSQNMLDRKEHGSETRPTAKLTVEQVIRIRRLLAQGRKPRQLAARFGVTPENVCHIRDRKTWRDI